jgi:hypothetical protein
MVKNLLKIANKVLNDSKVQVLFNFILVKVFFLGKLFYFLFLIFTFVFIILP